MNVLLFLAEHWQDILVVILIVVSSITGLNQWAKKNGPVLAKMSVQEKIAYTTRLLTNLAPIALVLVTKAEIDYGGGTGVLKRSYVIDELYKRIPDEYKKYITEDIVSVFSGKLPMDIQGTRSTTVNNELVQLTLTGTILESGNILVHETGREYESLSAACMDGLKHVSNGVEIQISGWRFWKDSRGESLYKYKEQASSVINTEQGSKDQEV